VWAEKDRARLKETERRIMGEREGSRKVLPIYNHMGRTDEYCWVQKDFEQHVES